MAGRLEGAGEAEEAVPETGSASMISARPKIPNQIISKHTIKTYEQSTYKTYEMTRMEGGKEKSGEGSAVRAAALASRPTIRPARSLDGFVLAPRVPSQAKRCCSEAREGVR